MATLDAGDDAARRNFFGSSADIQGNMAVFGQEMGGSAVVFENQTCPPADPWCEQTTLNIPDGEPDRVQDVAVSESTATVIVGASGGGGAAYVFVKTTPLSLLQCGKDWCLQDKFVSPVEGQGFGKGVAIEGDTVVVGAIFDDNACSPSDPNCNAGAAYVFERNKGMLLDDPFDDTWFLQGVELTAQMPRAGSLFGRSVEISGDTIIVGAPCDDVDQDGSTCTSGSAYVFERGLGWTDGSANQVAKLVATNPDAGDNFGTSVTIEDDTVVVGAWHDDGAGSNSGAAYVFQRGGGWQNGSTNQVAKLTASDGARSHLLGRTVSISGESIVAGATGGDAAYVFEGWNDCVPPCLLNEVFKLIASDGATNDRFGASVSISGDTAVVGAPEVRTSAGNGAGAGYVFERAAAQPGITVSPTSGLITTEAGGTDTFSVVLDTPPTADVTIGISSDDTSEGTVSPASVTFTTTNWNTPQTVTVTGVDDPEGPSFNDGDQGYTIVTAPASSTDPAYTGLDPADVLVSNLDGDGPVATTMHVGDLDGSSFLSGKNWTATVAVLVHDQNENLVAGASVVGSWSNGAKGTGSCTTDSFGLCSVSKKSRALSVTFTVDTVTLTGSTYDATANHDDDVPVDSDGTSIMVAAPSGFASSAQAVEKEPSPTGSPDPLLVDLVLSGSDLLASAEEEEEEDDLTALLEPDLDLALL